MTAQLAFHLPCRVAYGREDFFISNNTKEAIYWLDKWPDWPDSALVLYGPKGSGKTHLAHVWQAKTNALFVEKGTSFAEKHVIIDDAEQWEETHAAAFLHLYNNIKEQSGFLLITTSVLPRFWPISLPDLRSRILAAPLVKIQEADDTLLKAVLVKLFQDRQLNVDDGLLNFMLPRMERSFDAARLLVEKIDRFSLRHQRKITIPLVRDVLSQNND